jgi:uncharacterized membrane protein YhfC
MDIAFKVPSLSIVFMILTLVICFCYPIGMAVYLRIKKKANISPFFIGCGIFILFVLILENIFHQLILLKTGSFGKTITGNVWLYGLYGGLAAGVFEETGRFLSFKVLLSKKQKPSNALMYGAGHGGIEAIILVGFTYIVNLIVSFTVNSGNVSTLLNGTFDTNSIFQSILPLTVTPPYAFLMGGIERLVAITLHICLSVFVYKAVTEVGKKSYYFIAILIHTIVNFLAVIILNYYNIYVTELVLVIFVIAIVLITRKIYGQLELNKVEQLDVEELEVEESSYVEEERYEINKDLNTNIKSDEDIELKNDESIDWNKDKN